MMELGMSLIYLGTVVTVGFFGSLFVNMIDKKSDPYRMIK